MKHSARAVARQSKAAADGGGTPPWTAQVPYWIVLAGVVAGLASIRSGEQAVRSGTLVIACALLAGALARLVLPEGRAGMLRTRRRFIDVMILAALGAGLLTAGLILNVPGS